MDPDETFVTAQRIFGGVHPILFFLVSRSSPLRLPFCIAGRADNMIASVLVPGCQMGRVPLFLVLLVYRSVRLVCHFVLRGRAHSMLASVLVAGCQIAHARDKRFYQWRTLVVLWVAQQLAE